MSYNVSFHGGEACIGGIFTLPEYRRKGLMKYGCYRAFQWLKDKGVTKVRFAVYIRNIYSQRAFSHFSPYIYGRARYMQILWLRLYRETLITQTQHLKDI
ncbi:GNAT family N-acetyltransferase [Chloroflexota bacterium]